MLYLPESESLPQQITTLTALPVVLTIVFYTLYWLVASSGKLKRMVYSCREALTANIIHVVLKRTAGFLILGVIPLVMSALVNDSFMLADAGIRFNPETAGFTVISTILLSLPVIVIVYFSARKPSIYSIYPEIRTSRWTGGLLFAESISWALYLLGYEALFRGVLLFGLAQSTGQVAAITISVILYSLAHLPKGKTETLAAIPFGIILCILTLHSGSIWIAFLVHLVNALTTTVTAIKFNPVMNFAYQEKPPQSSDPGN